MSSQACHLSMPGWITGQVPVAVGMTRLMPLR